MKKNPIIIVFSWLVLAGCSALDSPDPNEKPSLMARGGTFKDLQALPKPMGKMFVSVYDFRDQTGQYKPSPSSNFSTAVSQGATSLLVMALLDSKWFVPLEREGLQNLLTERKIVRASNSANNLKSLNYANVMLEGGIVAYDTNVKTGGAGARYLGIGGSTEYRVDQVTVNLRAVEVATGSILLSVTTSKTILSQQVQGDVFRYVDYKDLLEIEAGYTTNEPVNIATMSAIDSAVVHLIVRGIANGIWLPASQEELKNPVYTAYLAEKAEVLSPPVPIDAYLNEE